MPSVTREQAFKIAEAYLNTHPMKNCVGIAEVLTWGEIDFPKPRGVYGFPPDKMQNCWIAYCKLPANWCSLTSSTIIVISKEDGSVQYAGSANDEG